MCSGIPCTCFSNIVPAFAPLKRLNRDFKVCVFTMELWNFSRSIIGCGCAAVSGTTRRGEEVWALVFEPAFLDHGKALIATAFQAVRHRSPEHEPYIISRDAVTAKPYQQPINQFCMQSLPGSQLRLLRNRSLILKDINHPKGHVQGLWFSQMSVGLKLQAHHGQNASRTSCYTRAGPTYKCGG